MPLYFGRLFYVSLSKVLKKIWLYFDRITNTNRTYIIYLIPHIFLLYFFIWSTRFLLATEWNTLVMLLNTSVRALLSVCCDYFRYRFIFTDPSAVPDKLINLLCWFQLMAQSMVTQDTHSKTASPAGDSLRLFINISLTPTCIVLLSFVCKYHIL